MDIDLVVAIEDFAEAQKILKHYRGGLPIDLHPGLKTLDTVPFQNLFENSRLVKCGDAEVRVLRPEDHLRVLCVHWLTDGGANKPRLFDVYYAVANRSADFDWDRCLNVVSQTRRNWIVCTILLANKYLGLPLKDTPLATSDFEVPNWLTETLEREWASGEILTPLSNCRNDKKRLWRQIKKRLPPNPIQATVDMEGEFDNQPRLWYQIGDLFYRGRLAVKNNLRFLIKSDG